MSEYQGILDFVRELYGSEASIPLHAPCFAGREKEYLGECIDTTLVSSVGPFVSRFETAVAEYTGSPYAIATVNGTQALFLALKLLGVGPGDLVITQSFTFVATANAILSTGARPAFVDVAEDTLGMCPDALDSFLKSEATRGPTGLVHRASGSRIAAVLPMHTFGHPCQIDEIAQICRLHDLPLVEDAAESLGSYRAGRHTGTAGTIGVVSFNGNKIITTGGGGMILTGDPALAKRARFLSTTAKEDHPYEFVHLEMGYNFRMPNINAALGLAQIEYLPALVAEHRRIAAEYQSFFEDRGPSVRFVQEPSGATSNYWLNAIRLDTADAKDAFIRAALSAGLQVRSAWRPMHLLPMYSGDVRGPLSRTEAAYETVVNLPSSAVLRRQAEAQLA